MIAVSFVNKRLAPDFSLLENCYGTTSKQNGKAYSTRVFSPSPTLDFFPVAFFSSPVRFGAGT